MLACTQHGRGAFGWSTLWVDGQREDQLPAFYLPVQSVRYTGQPATSGGGKPDRILDMIQDELGAIEFDGDVVIVRYRKNAR